VEPFTSIPGSGLAKAIEQSSAPLLKAGEQVRAQLAAVLFPAGEVQAITNDGTVTMQTT
jgi:hypothetical protein